MKTYAAYLLVVGAIECFKCPDWQKYGKPPPTDCVIPKDPQHRPKSRLETWFTEKQFNYLFLKANLGWGPHHCRPYNYLSFIYAARYFPKFGTHYVTTDPEGKKVVPFYTKEETFRRDVAAFFAHAIQETGENNIDLYNHLDKTDADNCFYRGGFYNWFEGGPISPFIRNQGLEPEDGAYCLSSGRYCSRATDNHWFHPCNKKKSGRFYKGCYYGRGAIQISYNFNYGLFNRWLNQQGITYQGKAFNLLENPNLIMTTTNPPLSIMASLWFYMTPQSGIPSMHDIVIGNWVSPDQNYAGAVFGPTSLIINNECGGEDDQDPGPDGENRRIKAFRWFTKYFKTPFNKGSPKTSSCKTFNGGRRDFHFHDGREVFQCWDVDWDTSWDSSKPCTCVMQTYEGYIPAYDPKLMPHMTKENAENKKWCEMLYRSGYQKQPCAEHRTV